MPNKKTIAKLKKAFQEESWIEFAFLFGSQVSQKSAKPRDWDFAFYADIKVEFWVMLGYKEVLRRKLSKLLKVDTSLIDLVDLNRAGLSIASSVVEEGIPIKGEGTLALEKYYQKIWALEEDFHWRLTVENRRISG